MPSNFVAAALAERTGEVLVTLLTISHPNLNEPLRVSSDSQQTVSRGNVFVPYPFALSLPPTSDGAVPVARLTISNVHRVIVEALRQLPLEPALSVVVEVVLASDPDVLQESWQGFELRAAEYDALRVSGELVPDMLDREPFPSVRVLPSTIPGVF